MHLIIVEYYLITLKVDIKMARMGSDEWKANISASLKGLRKGVSNTWSIGKQSEEHLRKRVESHAKTIAARGEYRGVSKSGENNQNAILNSEQVLEIVRLVQEGINRKEIAIQFGLSKSGIDGIMSGKNWSHVTGLIKREKAKKNDL